MRARRSGTRGLSLLEVLVAMLLLAVGLLALVPLFALGMKVNASANDLTNANTLAREKLEQLIGYPSTDQRLAIPDGATQANETNSPFCANDLPAWQKPATGETATQAASPGAGWFPYPCTRTYTVEAYPTGGAGTPLTSTTPDESVYNTSAAAPYYGVKLVTVTVLPTNGTLPGFRTARVSAYVRFRNAGSN